MNQIVKTCIEFSEDADQPLWVKTLADEYLKLLEVAKRMHQDLYEVHIPFCLQERVKETRKQFEELTQ